MIKWNELKPGQRLDYYENYAFKEEEGVRLSWKRIDKPRPHDVDQVSHYAVLKRHFDEDTLYMPLAPSIHCYFVEMDDGSYIQIQQAMEEENAQTDTAE